MKAGALIAGLAGLLLVVPAARADETIIAGPPFQYYTPTVTIDQGELVTFTNLDPIGHDVVARDKGPDGRPLFRSEVISGGASSPVTGAEYLVTGAYEFFCSIHASMVGTLSVTTGGTPAQRPPSGQPPSSPPPTSPTDTQAPSVTLRVLDGKLRPVLRRRALRVRVTASEPVTIGLTARAGRKRIASGTFPVSNSQSVSIRLSSAGRRTLARAKKGVKVTISANAVDAAGNATSAKTARTLAR